MIRTEIGTINRDTASLAVIEYAPAVGETMTTTTVVYVCEHGGSHAEIALDQRGVADLMRMLMGHRPHGLRAL